MAHLQCISWFGRHDKRCILPTILRSPRRATRTCDRELTNSFPCGRFRLHLQCNSGSAPQPPREIRRHGLPGKEDYARQTGRTGAKAQDSDAARLPEAAHHDLVAAGTGYFNTDPQRPFAVGGRQQRRAVPAQRTHPLAPFAGNRHAGDNGQQRQRAVPPQHAGRVRGNGVGQRGREQSHRNRFTGAEHQQGPPQRVGPVLAQPVQGPPQPRIRRGGRQACRWYRRNRSCSLPQRRSSSRAPCWPRSPGRTPDPGCRC